MAAVKHACTMGRHQLAAQLAARQAAFQFFQARFNDAEWMWHSVVTAARSAGDLGATAHAELHLVQFMAERGKNAEALEMLGRCGEVFELGGDQEALALVLQWRAYCAEQQGLLHQAQRDVQQGIQAARHVGDPFCELSCLRVLGQITTRLGDHAAGLEAGEQAVAIARELREPYAEYETLHTLAHASNVAGRYTAAVELCLQAMAVTECMPDFRYEVGEAYVLGSLGDAYHGLGRYLNAIDALSRAQRIFQDRGIQRGYALCLLKRARACQAVGRRSQAAQHLEEALPVFRMLHLTDYEQQVIQLLENFGGSPVPATGTVPPRLRA
jgi:tetratricopeptide (TPR) repeat protein